MLSFFVENDFYRVSQKAWKIYRLIGLAAAHESANSVAFLDVGNGGSSSILSGTGRTSPPSICSLIPALARDICAWNGIN
jgi:hypothetical protein